MRYLNFGLIAVAVSVVGLGITASAQQPTKTGSKANIVAGKELFLERCSLCHGVKADGNGSSYDPDSAEPSKRVPPADLTVLSKRNAGTFPTNRVRNAIFNKGSIPAHGTPEMPAWGNVFYDLKSRPQVYEERVRDLTAFIESVQGPSR